MKNNPLPYGHENPDNTNALNGGILLFLGRKLIALKLITKIYLAIGFILATFCAVTLSYLIQTKTVESNVDDVLKVSDIIKETETTQKLILDMETGFRGYLLTGDKKFLIPYYNGQKNFRTSITRLNSLTQSDPNLNKLIHLIDKDIQHWRDSFAIPLLKRKETAHLNASHQADYDALFAATAQLGAGKKIIDLARNKFFKIVTFEENRKEERLASMHLSLERTNQIALGLTLLAVLAGSATAYLLGRTIRKRFLKMTGLANAITQGNYNVTLKDNRKDEISDLTRSLNIMSGQLKQNFTHLTKKNQELDQFAYIVSHDLKAPLRAINNLAEWIAEDLESKEPDIIHNLTILRGRVQRMENLINGILEYAKIGRKTDHVHPFSAAEVINEALDNVMVGTAFQVTIPDNLPEITGERMLFYQVFSNLFSNAVKYHHKPEGTIEVKYTSLENFHQFEVQDDGPGIPPEYHSKVFAIFQTLAARDVKESTGVGLAIVQKIIEEKGGTIWIDSPNGDGANFVFTWPKDNPPSTSLENE